jgi:signal peptidase I
VAIATARSRIPAPVRALLEIVVMLALAFACAEGVQSAIAKPFRIPSGSMEPTLGIGQRVLVNRFIYHLRAPARGDIVVFHPPADLTCAVTPAPGSPCPRSRSREASTYFIKRIVALPGDRIAISDGHPVINGREHSNERYIRQCGGGDGCDLPDAITVPKGTYFVMGDNRGDSDDSRFWGPVPQQWLIGEAFFSYWPPDRVGGL